MRNLPHALQLAAKSAGRDGRGIIVLAMPGKRRTMDVLREERERRSGNAVRERSAGKRRLPKPPRSPKPFDAAEERGS
jgi:hypothetical protein